MCLAIPGKILEIERDIEPVMAKVSFGGIQKRICLEWLPEAGVGDYVLVHVGFAISKMNEQEAQETLKLLEEIEGAYEELEGDERSEQQAKTDEENRKS